MIRVVHLRKAALAGVAGAVAWEIAIRAVQLAGLDLFDLVQLLGTLVFPDGPVIAWWTAGMLLHAVVGALWAVFYAYFFWSVLNWRPVAQGMLFSLLPTTLALLIAFPQLEMMHLASSTAQFRPMAIISGVTWPDAAGLVLGHLVYGAVLGALYTHPVGSLAARPYRPAVNTRHATHSPPCADKRDSHPPFLFATGIECSYPTVEGGTWRRDEMDACGHYRYWRTDFERVREIGATHLRYGPPLHLIFEGPGRYDWGFTDTVMQAMKAMAIEPIADLCHFGVPSWLGNFQNPDVPAALADYARDFARRYKWIRYYTPVNEMFVCAKFSALDGLWNEQRRDERSFVTAVKHLAKANVLMMQAILAERPDAVFVNSESGEFYQPCCPDPEIIRIASFENERRFLTLDLIYAHPVSARMREYLRAHGMTDEEHDWFMSRPVPKRAILGIDYYEWNEKLVDNHGHAQALGELFGWYVIANRYYERYRRPMMHSETNRMDARDAPRWLWRQWHNVQLLRKAGVPLLGFTWYSLTDQVDWDQAMSKPLGTVNPVGLFDLNRDVRPVGLAYKYLIDIHRAHPDFFDPGPLDALLSGESDRCRAS
jgi:beta-glucosidase/6-phospho-beta-glucosidase/beta-galactosidase